MRKRNYKIYNPSMSPEEKIKMAKLINIGKCKCGLEYDHTDNKEKIIKCSRCGATLRGLWRIFG